MGGIIPLVVTVPGVASNPGSPTGIVFNNTGSSNFKGDFFVFANEDGTISGWKEALLQTIRVTGDTANVYKGLRIAAAA